MIQFTIRGVVPSLKNQKKIARGRMYNDPQVEAYKLNFGLQVPPQHRNAGLGSAKSLLCIKIDLFHDSWRRDADCEIIYDCLQASGVITNDRWVRRKYIEASRIDAGNPRAEIMIQEYLIP